ncbi:MAG: hypothetical protein HQM10_03910 [Candidatus Riflebacteria bacterium]|nr:hypothetical protein [Candidatus Riflebacteria bacterium]
MSKVMGVDVLVSAGGSVIGSQKDASLELSAKEIDVSDKDTGDWEQVLPGKKAWQISCDSVTLENDAAKTAILSAFLNGTLIAVVFTLGSGGTFSGNAMVSSYKFNGPQDDVSTASLSLKGSSALAVV